MSINSQRYDEADTVFFDRELTQKKAIAYEKKYPELKGRLVVPANFDYDPAVETIIYEMYDLVGAAQLVENYATDFRRVDTSTGEFSAKVKAFGASVGMTFQDIRRARMANKPLEQRKFNAARRAILLADDQAIALGNTQLGFTGVLNHPNVPEVSAVDIGGGVTQWENKTGEQIVADLSLGLSTILTQSNGVEQPNAVVLPPTSYSVAALKTLTNTSVTALQHFLKNQQSITSIESWAQLEAAGTSSSKRALFYKRDPDYLEHPVPQDFETPVPPQWKGGEMETLFHSRFGGVIIRYPLAFLYMDHI